ncbi:MAG: hypothetical protein QNL05_05200 [Gammaproteobacteria bacterium]|nr:hypothetical protein [Gammaproteobacteria bacterium]
MNTHSTLIELLQRLAATNDAHVFVTDEELSQWPDSAVNAMKSQRLLTKASPTTSAVCPGCERECIMPVHSLPTILDSPTSFIVCDKRSDINRVQIAAERLIQWQSSIDSIHGFITACLGLNRRKKTKKRDDLMEVGFFSAKKRSQMICLQNSNGLILVAGNIEVPLTELIQYDGGAYSLRTDIIRQMVDSSSTADKRHTPSIVRREARKLKTQERYTCWKKAYLALKKKRPEMSDKWCSQQIAKMSIADNSSAETIRKNMKI